MPIYGYSAPDRVAGRRQAAWIRHYMRKGANEWKAARLARKKTHTWPPTVIAAA